MAIAVTGGHVSRALDFYNKVSKYFSVGRTTAWEDETTPPSPNTSDYKVDELVALKKIDNAYLVVQDNVNGTIIYKDNKWRIVQPTISTTVGAGGVSTGSTSVPLASLSSIVVGIKLRVNDEYEGVITAIDTGTNTVTLSVAAPAYIAAGSSVLSGAYVEGAKYVYVECTLAYDTFPIVTYRQIGVQTGVVPNNVDILRSSAYSTSGNNEYTDKGILEILDNRPPITRQVDQTEKLSLILEF